MKGGVRVIGGSLRRRRIPVPAVAGLRPTPDRVRETLFNWIGADRLAGARCLDLYAGTGILGLEAASRGATKVLAVEREETLVRALRSQAERLGAGALVVVRGTLPAWLERAGEPFDLVFMDPPFDEDVAGTVAGVLERNGWLAPDALVYVESRRPAEALGLPRAWRMLRSNKAGQVRYHLASTAVGQGETGAGAA